MWFFIIMMIGLLDDLDVIFYHYDDRIIGFYWMMIGLLDYWILENDDRIVLENDYRYEIVGNHGIHVG